MRVSTASRGRSWLAGGSLVRILVTVAGILVAYYAMPIGVAGSRLAVGVVLTLAGVVAMAWAITSQIRRQLQDEEHTRPASLAVVVSLVLGLFAAGYYALEQSAPGQFHGLETRTDSLYFTLTTLTTVGYGDVHATGQVARALVSVQQVFDVVFVAALISTSTGSWPGAPLLGHRRPDTPGPEDGRDTH